MEVFVRSSGTLLAADEAPQVVEGQWDRDKVVLMAFPADGWSMDVAAQPVPCALPLRRCGTAQPNVSRSRQAGTTTVSSVPRRSTRMPARLATPATCAASAGSDLVVARARANRPLWALLKWLTTVRRESECSASTSTLTAPGSRPSAA